MKLHLLNDLHLEFCPFEPPPTAADVVLLAGDIAEGFAGLDWAMAHFTVPVLYVPGNHEYYHADLMLIDAMRAHVAGSQVSVLDGDAVVIDGVRFLGTTLWTDFDLFGADQRATAMRLATPVVADFRLITNAGRPFDAPTSRVLHAAAHAWLATALDQPFAGPTVVITHHAPQRGSLAPMYADDPVSAAFVSNLDHLMGKAALWVHGHTHTAFDYTVAGTRVVCNPRGYVRQGGRRPPENPAFRPDLLLTV